jgi:hypothetical protein
MGHRYKRSTALEHAADSRHDQPHDGRGESDRETDAEHDAGQEEHLEHATASR